MPLSKIQSESINLADDFAFTGTVTGAGESDKIKDTDNDTKIQVEESSDEDIVRLDTGGTERIQFNSIGVEIQSGGVGVSHPNSYSQNFTLAANKNMVLACTVTFSGTVTVSSGSTLVIF